MEIADSITVRYLSLAILFANAAPPLLLFAIFEQFQSICNLQGALRGDQPYCSAASKGDVLLAECHVPFPTSGARGPSRRGDHGRTMVSTAPSRCVNRVNQLF